MTEHEKQVGRLHLAAQNLEDDTRDALARLAGAMTSLAASEAEWLSEGDAPGDAIRGTARTLQLLARCLDRPVSAPRLCAPWRLPPVPSGCW